MILNPAPAQELPDALLKLVDVLTPNETETRLLTGLTVATREDAVAAARVLRGRGVGTVLMTLGERGALLLGEDDVPRAIPTFEVRVVDTTAAGDAFSGALAVALGEEKPMAAAARFACAAGALACGVMGAAPSLPQRFEIDRLLQTGS